MSIVINNYNYSAYLADAIDSALQQNYPRVEVIVVDDGSTDNSLAIAQGYGDRIKVVAKTNGGQASAFNAGFAASSGDWILFLDADDWLERDAVSAAAARFTSAPAKIHFPLQEVRKGQPNGRLVPARKLSTGDVALEFAETGAYVWPPTTGNLFARRTLVACLPVPEEDFRLCADWYVCTHAALLGKIATVERPLGFYRLHDRNNFSDFRMDPGWLHRRGYSLLMAERLVDDLLQARGIEPKHTPVRRCPGIETVLMGVRFGRLDLRPLGISQRELTRRWWQARRETGAGASLPVWWIFRWGPAFLVEWVMRLRIRKAERHAAHMGIAAILSSLP